MSLKFTVIISFILIACFNCKEEPKDPICGMEEFFKNDIIDYKYDDFIFNPKLLPIKRKTKRDELYKLDSRGPSRKWTNKKPFVKTIYKEKFEVDEIWELTSIKRKYIEYKHDNTIVTGSDPLESFSLFIFLNKGIVQNYFINHELTDDKGATWRPGKFNSGPLKNSDGIYPGAVDDAKRYWAQRSIGVRITRSAMQVTDEEIQIYKEKCWSKNEKVFNFILNLFRK
ncbi:MAG: hypothetical protein HS129_11420 [Leptospiraceae bacterium]|nr:hypothetical protein [Leptospiraceae bacterium]